MRKQFLWVLLVLIIFSLYLVGKYTTVFDEYVEYRFLTETELIELTKLRREAYEYAVRCSNTTTPALTFEQIHWELTPGNIIRFPRIEGQILELKGWFNPQDTTIYIPFTERETSWILAHESLHAIGYTGHPPNPFRTCKLMSDQNP